MVKKEYLDNDEHPLMNRKCPYCEEEWEKCSCEDTFDKEDT
jgi:hypothetical protein